MFELPVLPAHVDCQAFPIELWQIDSVSLGHFLCILRIFHFNKTLTGQKKTLWDSEYSLGF